MKKKIVKRFRGIENGKIVQVLEGDGTSGDNIYRIVHYVFSKNEIYLGKIDPLFPNENLEDEEKK